MKILRRWRSRGGQIARLGELIIPHSSAGVPNPLRSTLVVGKSGGSWNGYSESSGWGDWLGDGAGFVNQFSSHVGNNNTFFTLTIAASPPELGVTMLGRWVDFSIADFNGGAWNRLPETGAGVYNGTVAGFGTYIWNKNEGDHVPVLVAWDE